jgi:hypothetical protein
MSDKPETGKQPEAEPVKVPFGFNPRTTTDKAEIARDRSAGYASTERNTWYRAPNRKSSITGPMESA